MLLVLPLMVTVIMAATPVAALVGGKLPVATMPVALVEGQECIVIVAAPLRVDHVVALKVAVIVVVPAVPPGMVMAIRGLVMALVAAAVPAVLVPLLVAPAVPMNTLIVAPLATKKLLRASLMALVAVVL